jgi:hypothetical protein
MKNQALLAIYVLVTIIALLLRHKHPAIPVQPMYSFDNKHWRYFTSATNQLNKFGPITNNYFYVEFK